MAIVVEDGTGLSNAASYTSLAEFESHHTSRGVDYSDWDTSEIEKALVRATDYVEKRFGPRFRGYKQSREQSLEWPRFNAMDNDGYLYSGVDAVPRQLKKAISEYALIALQLEVLLPLPARPFATIDTTTGEVTSSSVGQVTKLRQKVGPIEEETTYGFTNATGFKAGSAGSSIVSDYNLPEYPVADEWLKELLKPVFGTLERA